MKPTALNEICIDPSKVISKLETILGPLFPSSGTIAGPGLAALLLSCIWGKDINAERFDHYADWLDEPVDPRPPIRYSLPGLSDEDHSSSSQNGFFTISIESRGMITRHVIQRCQPGLGKERVLQIIHALDLNAFGVGLDCYSKRLVATEAFAEFARTRQLKIQCPVSAESLLNLVKYRDVFGCYADIAEEAELTAGFRAYCDGKGDVWAYDNDVSAHGKVIYDLHRNELGTCCRLVELDDPVIPGLEVLMDVRYRLEFAKGTSRHQQVPITLMPANSMCPLNSYVFSAVFDRCIRKCISKTQSRRFLLALKYPATAYMVLSNPNCHYHDFNEKHADEIEQFFRHHQLCARILMDMHLDIYNMAQAIRKIRAFARKNGNRVIGLVEMHKRMGYHIEKIDNQTLEGLLNAYRLMAGRPLISNPVDFRKFEYRELVTELVATTDLECEGWKMRNCVGGYGNAVLSGNGRVRIFHIDGKKPSTVAIYHNEQENSFSSEVAGIANIEPEQEHLMITESLGRFLLKTIWGKKADKSEKDEEEDGEGSPAPI